MMNEVIYRTQNKKIIMPTLSVFYGIKVMMYWLDTGQHNQPHIHVKYAEYEAVIDIESEQIIVGDLPRKKLKLLQVWMDIHQEELIMNWKLAASGESTKPIEPLK
jgi:hypothetical protein